MKKFTLLFSFLVLSVSILSAQTANVTIQVNMSQITDMQEGGSVWVYMDSNWNEYFTMTPDASDSIYSYTIEKDVGATLTYRFSYQNGPNENSDYVEETVPSECTNNSGFRQITVPATDTTLAAVSYGSCYETGVTIRVDLSDVSNLHDGGSVWVYMDDAWNEYYTMTDKNGDGIYAYTLMKEADSTLYYSFSYQTGPDENSDFVAETVPDECAADNGFRALVIPAGDTVLPAFAYGSCNDTPPLMVNITFRVDMTNETVINNDVQVVIKNPWKWTALTDQGNGIWSAMVQVDPNNTYPYTFVNGGKDNWDGEESVAAGCNFGTESAPERHITVAETDTTLALTLFGECPVDVPTSKVTIQVNMSQTTDMQDSGSVWVYMDADWNEYYTMIPDSNNTIYSYTVEKAVGSKLSYSFSYQNGPDANVDYVVETVPDDCSNDDGFREIAVPENDTTLMAVAYGSCYEPGITLRVNLSEVTDLYEGGSVWVYMDADWAEYYSMTEEGDGIYSITLMKNASDTLYYSFSYQNGADEWNDFVTETVPDLCAADNGFRMVLVPATDTVLPAFAFSSCDESGPGTVKITFQVNMSEVTVLNNDVQIVIKNPWIWTTLTDQGDDIWTGTVEVNANTTYPYTFVNGGENNWDGEESVPEACNAGTESAPERHVSVLDTDTTLALVDFGSCETIVSVKTVGKGEVKIYPNPANEYLNIHNSTGSIQSVKIIDITGRVFIQKKDIESQSFRINISRLSEGMYSVITQGDNFYSVDKIIVNNK